MAISAQLPALIPLARTAIALDALALRPGQSVQAQVLGQSPGGGGQVLIAGHTFDAALQGRPQPGTLVQLQLQGSGANARLVEVPPQSGTPVPGAPVSGKPELAILPQPAPGDGLQQVISQTAQGAVARQDSIGSLLASLAGLDGKLAAMPAPVGEAALKLLAVRLNLNGKFPDGPALKDALMRSGILYENGLRNGATPAALQGDMKAALLSLRGALAGWLGGDAAAPLRSSRRPPPPTRGAVPRAEPSSSSPLPANAAPKEAARMLLAQTEAALSRLRLTQISSLPEAGMRATPDARAAGEWHFELPLLWSGDMSMAQFRISRDGGSEAGERDRGWQLRFSINFNVIGEVNAHISLRGKHAGVMLWAEREETAAALEELLPELGDALSARGVEPGRLQVRRGVPAAPARPAGHFVDGRS